MMGGGTPILVLKEGTRRERGKGAQYNNIAAAKAVADAVRSTLGPRGMDKMLVDSLGDVVITNDGVTILKEIFLKGVGIPFLWRETLALIVFAIAGLWVATKSFKKVLR